MKFKGKNFGQDTCALDYYDDPKTVNSNARHMRCLSASVECVPSIKSYADLLAGGGRTFDAVGCSNRLIGDGTLEKVWLNDQDERCYQELVRKYVSIPYVKITCLDIVSSDVIKQTEEWDLTYFDFNEFTSLAVPKYLKFYPVLRKIRSSWIMFTETACRYLHLNFHSYGLTASDLEVYYQQEVATIFGDAKRLFGVVRQSDSAIVTIGQGSYEFKQVKTIK